MLASAVPLLIAGCGSNHHVSPWGAAGRPSLGAFTVRADLDDQLALVDAETAPQNLRLATELSAELPHGEGPVRIRGYEGKDAVGRPTHAVRVATKHGVAMAVGPLDPHDPDREQATELVPALVPGEIGAPSTGAYRSGTDLNGDGLLDVALRSERGAIEIWRITPLGASRYDVAIEAPPTRAEDIDGDGSVDLLGDAPIDAADPIAPRFIDVATFDKDRYSDRTEGALAFHARLAEERRDAKDLRGALERAWHGVLSGEVTKEAARKDLDRQSVPPKLRPSFDKLVARIDALKAREAPRRSRP